jgi:hypothetical protein
MVRLNYIRSIDAFLSCTMLDYWNYSRLCSGPMLLIELKYSMAGRVRCRHLYAQMLGMKCLLLFSRYQCFRKSCTIEKE